MYLLYTHLFFQPYCHCSFHSLDKPRSSTIFLYFNIADITVSSPSVCPFYCSATGSIRGLIFIKLFVEYKYSGTSRSSEKFMWGKEYCIKILHFIFRMHVNFDIGCGGGKIDKAESPVLMHYFCQFVIWRKITGYI